MDAQNYAGGSLSSQQRIRDANVCIRELTVDEWIVVFDQIAYAKPERFAELVEAITRRNRTLQGEVLRRWGVWR